MLCESGPTLISLIRLSTRMVIVHFRDGHNGLYHIDGERKDYSAFLSFVRLPIQLFLYGDVPETTKYVHLSSRQVYSPLSDTKQLLHNVCQESERMEI